MIAQLVLVGELGNIELAVLSYYLFLHRVEQPAAEVDLTNEAD